MYLLKVVISMRKIIDVTLEIDSLELEEWETVEDVCKLIEKNFNIGYDINYEVSYEEIIDD